METKRFGISALIIAALSGMFITLLIAAATHSRVLVVTAPPASAPKSVPAPNVNVTINVPKPAAPAAPATTYVPAPAPTFTACDLLDSTNPAATAFYTMNGQRVTLIPNKGSDNTWCSFDDGSYNYAVTAFVTPNSSYSDFTFDENYDRTTVLQGASGLSTVYPVTVYNTSAFEFNGLDAIDQYSSVELPYNNITFFTTGPNGVSYIVTIYTSTLKSGVSPLDTTTLAYNAANMLP